MPDKGSFTISLDFELYWGVRDVKTIDEYEENIRNVHSVIPLILDLFIKYEIHATWCIVGFLFYKNKNELVENLPGKLPGYKNKNFDPYHYISTNELENIYHFAPASVELIKNTINQEIGTHTFSHYYCLEEGQNIDEFNADLFSAIKISEQQGISCDSIVFPRNQYNDEYLKVAKQNGIKYYRGTERSSYYKPKKFEEESLRIRISRLADSYINLSGHNLFKTEKNNNILPVNVPASRFLRPYNSKLHLLENMRYKRIANSMTKAAKDKSGYHLWWHPHNFGKNIPENLEFLERILIHYKKLKQQYDFKSCCMNEY